MGKEPAYFETWKQHTCPLDHEKCMANACAIFHVIFEKIEGRNFEHDGARYTDGFGYCSLPHFTKNSIETLRRIRREGIERSEIDLGSPSGNIPGDSGGTGC